MGVQSTALLAWGFCRNSPAFEPKPTTHWSRACYYRHGHARSAQPIGALKQTPSAHSPMLGLDESRVDADGPGKLGERSTRNVDSLALHLEAVHR